MRTHHFCIMFLNPLELLLVLRPRLCHLELPVLNLLRQLVHVRRDLVLLNLVDEGLVRGSDVFGRDFLSSNRILGIEAMG